MRSDKSDHVCEQTIWQCTGQGYNRPEAELEGVVNDPAHNEQNGDEKSRLGCLRLISRRVSPGSVVLGRAWNKDASL